MDEEDVDDHLGAIRNHVLTDGLIRTERTSDQRHARVQTQGLLNSSSYHILFRKEVL